jgi:hypothetical protein
MPINANITKFDQTKVRTLMGTTSKREEKTYRQDFESMNTTTRPAQPSHDGQQAAGMDRGNRF